MPRHLTDEQKQEAIRLRTEKRLIAPEIAVALSISNWAAYHYTQDYPLSPAERLARRRNAPHCWSKTELRKLRELWPTKDKDAILRALPRRKWPNIVKRASEIGIHRPRIITNKKHRHVDPIFIELRALRQAQRLTREELAEIIGVHRQMVSHYELGTTLPRWANFRAWIEALGYDIKLTPRNVS